MQRKDTRSKTSNDKSPIHLARLKLVDGKLQDTLSGIGVDGKLGSPLLERSKTAQTHSEALKTLSGWDSFINDLETFEKTNRLQLLPKVYRVSSSEAMEKKVQDEEPLKLKRLDEFFQGKFVLNGLGQRPTTQIGRKITRKSTRMTTAPAGSTIKNTDNNQENDAINDSLENSHSNRKSIGTNETKPKQDEIDQDQSYTSGTNSESDLPALIQKPTLKTVETNVYDIESYDIHENKQQETVLHEKVDHEKALLDQCEPSAGLGQIRIISKLLVKKHWPKTSVKHAVKNV